METRIDLIKFYGNLDEDQKKKFIKAILTKNSNLLTNIPTPSTIFRELTYQFQCTKKSEIINETLLSILQNLIMNEKGDALFLSQLLIKTFEAIPETKSTSDTGICIDMQSKFEILNLLVKFRQDHQKIISAASRDLSYDPKLPSFRPTLGDGSYIKSRISIAEFKTIFKSPIDISEYIIITLGMLRQLGVENTGPGKVLLKDIMNDYLFVRYDTCLEKIRKYCQARIELARIYPDHSTFKINQEYKSIFPDIINYSYELKDFNPNINHARRFFETRLAQYITGLFHTKETINPTHILKKKNQFKFNDHHLHHQTLKSINKILQFYLGQAGHIENINQLEVTMSLFCNGYKDESKFDPKVFTNILQKSPTHQKRDRINRTFDSKIIERKYELDPKSVGDSIWNSSGGVMFNLTPSFLDAQISPPVRNMLVDVSCREECKNHKTQWSRENNRHYTPFVGSISGHTAKIIGMLITYMEKCAKEHDPDLNKDLHCMFITIMALNVKRGFHSILEVLDMLSDKYIQSIFREFGVEINLEKLFVDSKYLSPYLDFAMNDALSYTKTLTLKRSVLSELIEKTSITKKSTLCH